MSALRYAGPFAFLAAVPVLYQLSCSGPYLIPLILVLALVVTSHIPDPVSDGEETAAAQLLPILYVPCQLAAIGWGIWEVVSTKGIAETFLSLAVSVGACGGVFGVLAAHELIHSPLRWHRKLGLLMLTGISYRHFSIAHLYGHHRFAVTKRDPSTARMDESFYGFLVRTVVAQALYAWQFEKRRLSSRNFAFLHNRAVHDIIIAAVLYAVLLLGLGWGAAAFLAVQSLVAIFVLELFNYVAHYGLARREGEPMGERHSWNSPGAANLLLFNMGRHGDHHRAPASGFIRLRRNQSGPELPGGYAGAILLALVPPLWRTVMHRRLNVLGASAGESRYGAGAVPAAAAP